MVSLKNGWTYEWLKSDWVSEFMKERFSFTTLDKKNKKKRQRSDSRWEFLNIEKEQIRTVQNNSYE